MPLLHSRVRRSAERTFIRPWPAPCCKLGSRRLVEREELIQLLLKNDLVDELRLKIFPLILGIGKKLFGNGIIPAAFTLTESVVTTTGVIIANYKRAGKVETGTIGA